MRVTAFVLFVVSLVLAVSAVVVSRAAGPDTWGNGGSRAVPWGSSTLTIAVVIAAGGAALLAWAMLRFGGKGYTETNSPPVRR